MNKPIIYYIIIVFTSLTHAFATRASTNDSNRHIVYMINAISTQQDSMLRSNGIDSLMTIANQRQETLQLALELAEQHFLQSGKGQGANTFTTIVDKADLSILDNAYKDYWEYKRELAMRNRIGSKATDFAFTLPNGTSANLYGIESPYIILFFNDPDCEDCQKAKQLFSAVTLPDNVKIVSIYPNDDIELWEKSLSSVPSTWINGIDKELVIDSEQLYELKTSPTLYLLDAEKNVILKDATPLEIINLLSL